jgi:hypothetical protein
MQRAPLAARSRVIFGTIVAILGACSKFHANVKEVGPVRGAVVWIRGVNILMVSDQPLLPTYLTDTVIVRAAHQRRRGAVDGALGWQISGRGTASPCGSPGQLWSHSRRK